MENEVSYTLITSAADFALAGTLFKEYAAYIGIDLSFQNFEKELQALGGQYSAPEGALILAYLDDNAVGCVGVRRLEADIAELKRMYVKPEARRHGIGVGLLERALENAVILGYQRIRLDTLAHMTKAQELYRRFGFYTILPYRFNPLDGAVYMEKELFSPAGHREP